jgi:16S rRNA (cytidine1402-2'-O)-methyltransferase
VGRSEPTTGPGGGVLYVVATPIGNLEDVTLRALRVLREVDLIAAEDTRRTRLLLQHHGISRPLTSYYDAVERSRAPAIVEKLRQGARVALVSDAGTPGIADPGLHLVRGAVAAGVPVVPVPGPSAAAALVSVAGMPVDRFVFEGFLPSRPGPRRRRLAGLAAEPRALVFLEAPTRLEAFLADAEEVLGDREAVVGRELTKLHEELLRGPLSALRATLRARERVRGEATIVVAGAAAPATVPVAADLDDAIRRLRAAGRSVREIAAELARETGTRRRDVYRRALALVAERTGRG